MDNPAIPGALKGWRYPLYLSLALLLIVCPVIAEQSGDDENVVNYAYAVIFGTGAYKVKDQKAFLFRIPFSYQVREASPPQPGLRILLPAIVGYYDYDYDNIFEGDLPGDTAVTSFVPGLEYSYELSPAWRLKPFGQLGVGRDIQNSENALIYVAGVTSRYRLPVDSRFRFALGNSAVFTGYDPEDGASQSMGILGTGLDVIYPWGVSLFGKETTLTSYVIYYLYLDNPQFEQGDDRAQKVNGEVELGLALGFEKPPTVLGMTLERIGLGFRYGGDIRGVRIVTDFPF